MIEMGSGYSVYRGCKKLRKLRTELLKVGGFDNNDVHGSRIKRNHVHKGELTLPKVVKPVITTESASQTGRVGEQDYDIRVGAAGDKNLPLSKSESNDRIETEFGL